MCLVCHASLCSMVGVNGIYLRVTPVWSMGINLYDQWELRKTWREHRRSTGVRTMGRRPGSRNSVPRVNPKVHIHEFIQRHWICIVAGFLHASGYWCSIGHRLWLQLGWLLWVPCAYNNRCYEWGNIGGKELNSVNPNSDIQNLTNISLVSNMPWAYFSCCCPFSEEVLPLKCVNKFTRIKVLRLR